MSEMSTHESVSYVYCKYVLLNQGSANSFRKGPDSKQFRHYGPQSSHCNYSTLSLQHEGGYKQYINKWTWIYSNKTSFTHTQKPGRGPDRALWATVCAPCSGLLLIFLFMKTFCYTEFLFKYDQFFPIFSYLCFGVLFKILFATVCIKYFVLFIPLKALKSCFLHLCFQSTWNVFLCDVNYESNFNFPLMAQLSKPFIEEPILPPLICQTASFIYQFV